MNNKEYWLTRRVNRPVAHPPVEPVMFCWRQQNDSVAQFIYVEEDVVYTLGYWGVGPNGPAWLAFDVKQDLSCKGTPEEMWGKTIGVGPLESQFVWLIWGDNGWAPSFYQKQEVSIS